MPASQQRANEIVAYSKDFGEEATLEKFDISHNTLSRYRRLTNNFEAPKSVEDFDVPKNKLLEKIAEKYSDVELKQMLKSPSLLPTFEEESYSFDGTEITFGAFGDTHIGSQYTDESFIKVALDEFEKQGCSFIVHGGDVTEGMSGRDGHVYELTHMGYQEQKDAAVRCLGAWTKPIYMIAGNHDCLSPDTECLTQRGWLSYDQLTLEDKILSYNTDTGLSQWDKIKEIIVQQRKEDLVQIDAKGYQFLGTKNHRTLIRKGNSSKWQYSTADYSKKTKISVKVASTSNLPDFNISDDMLRVVAWLLTDGSIYRQQENHTGRYCIHQSKDISNIEKALYGAGLEYTLTERVRDITEVCGKILKKKPLNEKVFNIVGSKSLYDIKEYLPYKKFPDWLYQISDRQYKIFMEVVKQANGSVHKNFSTKAYAVYGTKENLDQLQILCVQHGDRAWLKQDSRNSWLLNITPEVDTLQFPYTERKSYVAYEGVVWCLAVPLTNFMVRRNGTPYFTGNCWYMKKGDIGANIVKDICEKLPNAHYLGMHEGDVTVGNCKIKLWHGEDGSSYSTSYRLQKIVESFSGGEKPAILLCSHTHKQGYFFERNIQVVSLGSMQKQSAWMRYKRLAAHVGFFIIKMSIDREGHVLWFEPRWYPFYK